MDASLKVQNNSVDVLIEISIDGNPLQEGNYGMAFHALMSCAASIAKKIGATTPHGAADAARDQFLLAWENATEWQDSEQ